MKGKAEFQLEISEHKDVSFFFIQILRPLNSIDGLHKYLYGPQLRTLTPRSSLVV